MANYTQAPWVEGNKTTYKEFQPPPEAFKKKPTLYDGFQELKSAFTTMIAAAKKDGGSFREIFSGNKDAGKQDNTTQGATTYQGTKIPTVNPKALEQWDEDFGVISSDYKTDTSADEKIFKTTPKNERLQKKAKQKEIKEFLRLLDIAKNGPYQQLLLELNFPDD